jgi:pimeloyl-ACP methyl ester carboxylesterase
MNVFANPSSYRVIGAVAPELGGRAAAERWFTAQPPPPRDWELPVLRSARAVTFGNGANALQWGSGPGVLLLHGWDGRSTQFARLVPQLVAGGRTAVALHAPGHGSPADGLSVLGFMRSLLAVGDELGPVEAVVGHSMGGAAALLAAAEGLACRRVVALSAPSALADALARHADALALPARVRSAFLAEVDRRLGLPAAVIETAALVAGLALPVLLMHDRDDRSVPFADAGKIAAALPQARLRATHGMRHALALGDDALMAEVADFVLGREVADAEPPGIALAG